MKEKFKIAIINIRRIIMSFGFINLIIFSQYKVKGIGEILEQAYCTWPGNTEPMISNSSIDKVINYSIENAIILLVFIPLIVSLIIFIIKKIKNKMKINNVAELEKNKKD